MHRVGAKRDQKVYFFLPLKTSDASGVSAAVAVAVAASAAVAATVAVNVAAFLFENR